MSTRTVAFALQLGDQFTLTGNVLHTFGHMLFGQGEVFFKHSAINRHR
jgi:hypothetical protein